MSPILPPRPLRRRFVVRVVVVWLLLRAAALVGASMEAGPDNGVAVGLLPLALLVDPIVLAVVLWEMRRRSELLFLANLGWSVPALSVSVVGICLLLEAVLRVTVG